MDLPPEIVSTFKLETSVALPDPDTNKIQTGVALPTAKNKKKMPPNRKGLSKYPFAKMRPPRPNGDMDSFAVKYDSKSTEKNNKQRIASAIFSFTKQHPKFKKCFEYHVVTEKGQRYIRVWRVK